MNSTLKPQMTMGSYDPYTSDTYKFNPNYSNPNAYISSFLDNIPSTVGMPDTSYIKGYGQGLGVEVPTFNAENYISSLYNPKTLPVGKINVNMDGLGGNQTNFDTGSQNKDLSFGQKLGLGANVALGAIGAFNAYNANKLGKRELANNRDQFERNFAAQKNITNSQLEDRQRARVYADPKNAMSVSDYMAKYGIK